MANKEPSKPDKTKCNEDKRMVLIKHIGKYIKSTILGHESGIYKAASGMRPMPQKLFNLKEIKDDAKMKSHITFITIQYFNKTWESLIKRNDDYVNKIWNNLQSVMNHGAVCLMTIIGRLCVEINCSLDRSKFDTSSYNKYIQIVENMLDTIFIKEYYNILLNMISHRCEGDEKATPVIDESGNIISFFQLKDKKDIKKGGFNYVINDVMSTMGNVAKAIVNEKPKERKKALTRCANCRKETKKRCSGCKNRYLCNRSCQKEDWKYHKHSCKFKK